jgi:hypothetical protein
MYLSGLLFAKNDFLSLNLAWFQIPTISPFKMQFHALSESDKQTLTQNNTDKNLKKIFSVYLWAPIFWKIWNLLDLCAHRATNVTQAYLKSFIKNKKRDRRIFSFKHYRKFWFGFQKIIEIFFECLVPVLRGVDL